MKSNNGGAVWHHQLERQIMKAGKIKPFAFAVAATLSLVSSSNADPDLVGYMQAQHCPPRMKTEWLATQVTHSTDPDLVSYMQAQHCPPRMKTEWLAAHVAPATD